MEDSERIARIQSEFQRQGPVRVGSGRGLLLLEEILEVLAIIQVFVDRFHGLGSASTSSRTVSGCGHLHTRMAFLERSYTEDSIFLPSREESVVGSTNGTCVDTCRILPILAADSPLVGPQDDTSCRVVLH